MRRTVFSLIGVSVYFLWLAAAQPPVLAQSPAEDVVTESVPETTPADPLVLPETEVVGRPNSFPGRPLGDESL